MNVDQEMFTKIYIYLMLAIFLGAFLFIGINIIRNPRISFHYSSDI